MTGVAPREPLTRSLDRWNRAVVLGTFGLAAVAAWWILAHHGWRQPHGAAQVESFLTPILLAFAMWLVMSIAMMLPPVLPWILFFQTASAKHDRPYVPVAAFVSGYFVVWSLYSIVAATVQVSLPSLLGVRLLSGGAAGGLVLIGAGAFQFSTLKAACLAHCRSPLGFFLAQWRDGPRGALQMGLLHGLFCLGCCWALMAVCLAAGVMSLSWMVGLTLLMCAEKIAPRGLEVGRLAGVGLMGWGGWMLAVAG